MFDFNFSELALIGVVALVVIGPERLPKVARTAGLLLGRAQRYAATVRADISREIELSELKRLQGDMQDAARSVQQTIARHASDVQGAARAFEQTLEAPAASLTASAAPAVSAMEIQPAPAVPHADHAPESVGPLQGSPTSPPSVATGPVQVPPLPAGTGDGAQPLSAGGDGWMIAPGWSLPDVGGEAFPPWRIPADPGADPGATASAPTPELSAPKAYHG